MLAPWRLPLDFAGPWRGTKPKRRHPWSSNFQDLPPCAVAGEMKQLTSSGVIKKRSFGPFDPLTCVPPFGEVDPKCQEQAPFWCVHQQERNKEGNLIPSHQFTWNLTGGSWKTISLLKRPPVRFHVDLWEGSTCFCGTPKRKETRKPPSEPVTSPIFG